MFALTVSVLESALLLQEEDAKARWTTASVPMMATSNVIATARAFRGKV
jgi:hypothetical protein